MKLDFEQWNPPAVTRATLDARRARRQRNICIALTALLAVACQTVLWMLWGVVNAENPDLGRMMAQTIVWTTVGGVAVLAAFAGIRRGKRWQLRQA